MSKYNAERWPCFHTWMDAGTTNSAAKATKIDGLKGPIQSAHKQEHQRHAVQRHQRIEKLEMVGTFLAKSKNRLTNKMVVTPEKMPTKCTARRPNHEVPSHPGITPWYPAKNNCDRPPRPKTARTASTSDPPR